VVTVYRCLVGWLALLLITGITRDLKAESNIRLVYAAADGCPSQAEFVAAVGGRGGYFDRPPKELGGGRMDVSIRKEAGGFVGSFGVQESQVESGVREVHANSCGEVMQGLAVITALVLRRGSDEPASALAVPSPPAVAPLAAEPEDYHLRSIGQFESETLKVGAGSLTFAPAISYTLTGGAAIGVIPSVVMPRFDLTLSRANFVTTPEGDNYLIGGWLPKVRWSWLGPASYESNDFSTKIWGLKAGFSGCSSLTYDTRGAVILLCGEIGTGLMQLDTTDAAGVKVQSKAVGLGFTGFELDSRYNIGKFLHVNLKLGGELSLSKLTAERPDGSEIFHSSPFSAYVQVGLGFHF
jgi:hypothetical protein